MELDQMNNMAYLSEIARLNGEITKLVNEAERRGKQLRLLIDDCNKLEAELKVAKAVQEPATALSQRKTHDRH